MTPALDLEGIGVRRGGRTVLEDVSIAFSAGEMVGVVGPNGAGKSTLLRAALGLQRLSHGEVRVQGRPIGDLSAPEKSRAAAFLPQERRVAWNMPALEVAALGALDLAPAEARSAALACLEELEIGALAARGVLDMSGGERARVLLARLLVTRARVLLVDEPAAGLDPEAQILMLERLRARTSTGAAVVVTSHDLTAAARACDRIAVMAGGRLVALGPPAASLTPEILAAVFALDGALIPSAAGPTLAARRLPLQQAASGHESPGGQVVYSSRRPPTG